MRNDLLVIKTNPKKWVVLKSDARTTLDKQPCIITSTSFRNELHLHAFTDLNSSCLATSTTSSEVSSCQNEQCTQIQYGRPCLHFERVGAAECEWWQVEINQLLFADDTALVADSEDKLCRLVSEFGRVCERIKLRVNVGKSKVMRCSRYGNGDRMHVILNGEPLEGVD